MVSVESAAGQHREPIDGRERGDPVLRAVALLIHRQHAGQFGDTTASECVLILEE